MINDDEICPVCFEFLNMESQCDNTECPDKEDQAYQDRIDETIKRSIR